MLKQKLLPSVIIFVLAVAVLYPQTVSLAQHGDEMRYVWRAGYYGNLLIHLDFQRNNPGDPFDPGWYPLSEWAKGQPWGSSMLYAISMGITGTRASVYPYSYVEPLLQGINTRIPGDTLPIVRSTAVLATALGLALIVFRLGWRGLAACALFLCVPHVREDMARAWAEGPLLLGVGLCVLSYGTPWFVPAVGLATGFKLTAIVLWPVIWFMPPIRFRYMRHILNVIATAFVFALTTPVSWFAGGPAYLGVLLVYRLREFLSQSSRIPTVAGLFFPTRYVWPLELALLLGASFLLPLVIKKISATSILHKA